MPAISLDHSSLPTRPELVYFTIPAKPDSELVEKIQATLKEKGKAAVAISPDCNTLPGRRKVLLALRGAGLSGADVSQLGWATAAAIPATTAPAPAPAPAPPPKAKAKTRPRRARNTPSEPKSED